jgi:P pilus assembly chaperone PapD
MRYLDQIPYDNHHCPADEALIVCRKKVKNYILIALIGCMVLPVLGQKTEQSGIEVRPATLEFSVAPGTTATKKVYVTNTLSSKTQFTAYLSDWRRDTIGSHVFTEPGQDPRSCASFVTIDKPFFELEPGQRQEINVTLQEPIDSPQIMQMKWCMFFIETIKEKQLGTITGFKTTISNRYRVGVHIYQTPPGVTEKEVRLHKMMVLEDSVKRYRLICQNTGSTQLQCTSYMELFSMQDGSKMKLPSQEFPLFPEQVRYVDFMLPEGLAKGKYVLTGIIDAGEEVALEAGELTIEID